MKHVFRALIAGLAVIALSAPVQADVNDFTFASFEADYTLSRDVQHVGHLHVVEHLEAVFPDFDQNHGIIRAIPETYEGRNVHLKVASVADGSGHSIPYSKSSSNHNLELKIGRAEQYVHGHQNYIITYDMDHVTAQPAGYDGLFWDVNGDQWSQPFDHVTAHIHTDSSVPPARDPSRDRCFTGSRGSQAQNCTIEIGDDGAVTVTADHLTAGQTLTYELGFQSGTFVTRSTGDVIALVAKVLLLLLPIALALWYCIRRWRRQGRDPAGRGTVIAEYTPPKDLSVLAASAILNEGFRPKAITATILDLAVRGYLKIYEVKQTRALLPDSTTYELELSGDPDKLRSEERDVVRMLFGASPDRLRVDIKKLANKLYSQANILGSAVNQTVTDADYFAANPERAKTGNIWRGAVLFGAAALAFYFQPFLAAGLAVAGAIIMAFAGAMPARTAKGVEARDILRGLKLFITMAEADRIKAMQSPHGSLTEKVDTGDPAQLVKLYEKLLPYAMLFGLEKDWIKEFAGLYKEPPDWYQGSGAFNAVYFVGAMSSFSAAANAGFTPPSSSGSGGSAGGGGGGGGGGGW